MPATDTRELAAEFPNPLGLDGIEFVEYSTAKPQALGHVLELMGFRPVARHRSREVLLYRQGGINVIINGHEVPPAQESPQLVAVAFRVRDAAAAYRAVQERGAWPVPTRVEVMELNIPAIHGVGSSRIYFVDRYRDFSIYDVDFVPLPGVPRSAALPPELAGVHLFGVVQYIGAGRMADWCAFYGELFGFTVLPKQERFGILPKGEVLQSPCNQFYWQLVDSVSPDSSSDEHLQRLGLGVADVLAASNTLRARGVEFMESSHVHTEARGALTKSYLGGVMFELVHDERV